MGECDGARTCSKPSPWVLQARSLAGPSRIWPPAAGGEHVLFILRDELTRVICSCADEQTSKTFTRPTCGADRKCYSQRAA